MFFVIWKSGVFAKIEVNYKDSENNDVDDTTATIECFLECCLHADTEIEDL